MRNLQSKKFITSTPYFGNARVTYKKRKAEGKRIVKLEIGVRGTNPVVYKPIDLKRKYQFSTIDFIGRMLFSVCRLKRNGRIENWIWLPCILTYFVFFFRLATGGDHLVPRVLKDVTKREDIAVVFEEYIKTNSPVLPHLNPQMINLEGGHKRSWSASWVVFSYWFSSTAGSTTGAQLLFSLSKEKSNKLLCPQL